jgi:isopenicillin N synthase-like dioxygenase
MASFKNHRSVAEIPVIDVSGSSPETQVAKEIVDAAATNGFVYIKNEGKDIPVDLINRTFELVRVFKRSGWPAADA